jgi:anti-sigma regulatory factor (Ser/Thr protein kinase)
VAVSLGFTEQAVEEIIIAVSELANNLVRHAGGGAITLTPISAGGSSGLQVESVDDGPGIGDPEEAMGDGYSTKGGLGYGLGTVNRLMHDCEVRSPLASGRGTRIVTRRWVHQEAPAAPCPVDVGVSTRPHPKMAVNGDAFVVSQARQRVLVAVIDGLGHGPLAHLAAEAARRYVESHADQQLSSIFVGVGRACRATQGVVMALARVDWWPLRLTFASVGNVEARVLGSSNPINLLARRGVLGMRAPPPLITEHRWEDGMVVVLHSDGLTARWRAQDVLGSSASAEARAQHCLRAFARDDDDATVLVVQQLGSS